MHDKENPRSEDVDDGRRASSDFNTSSDVEKNAPSAIDDNRHSKPTDEGQNDADLSDQTTEAGNLDDTAAESFEVSWDGDKDPMCPRSMSRVRKWVIVSIACMGSLCVTCASSIYTATYAQMNAEFNCSQIVATLGLSTFVLGIALGPVLTSPLSEYYGRRPIYLVSWTMFIIWTIPSAVAQNIETMIIARFFTGFAGSSFLSVAGGTAGDVFERHEIQKPMSLVSLAPFIGPTLGPLMGGFINYNTNWRWTYYVMLIWAVILMVAIFFFAPETFHPILLREKARKIRKETGKDAYWAPMERTKKPILETLKISILRPFQLLFLEPMCLCLDLYSALLLGILYLFFGAFPLVFRTNHGMNLWQVGMTFLGILVGTMVATATTPIWAKMRAGWLAQQEKETGKAISEPEYRLPPCILGAILAPIGLFWFAWSTYADVHWIVPIIGSGVFGCGMLLSFTGIFTFLVDAYPQYAASAMAANSFARCSFAAAFPLFGIQMYEKLGYQWASSLLAFLTVAMAPFPWLFFKYGKQLRAKSKFASKA
ncbi:major facilitator superfamily domain-containing protein [Fusarium acuminatum]|uniref:Major facilitator superfamily domain-containing protein n=1 Tax=Fusarium acuminatum TaxID=5515 RepID=A0ABZ2WL03_9HYPO